MNPDQIFAIVNPLAALSWLALIVVPRRAAMVTGLVVPALFAALYAALIAVNWSGADGGFSTLPEVARLFANRWLLLAGWVHYLCFDLLDRHVGGPGRADARRPAPARRPLPHPHVPVRPGGVAVV